MLDHLVNKQASLSTESIAMKTQVSLNTAGQGLSTATEISQSKKFNLKTAKKLLSAFANVFQVLDGAMAIFSLVEMFLPQSDSPELAFMKSQFGIVNTKLDTVLSGQDKILAAIKFLQLTNHIDVAKIEHIDSMIQNLLPILRKEMSFNGTLSQKTEYALEDFKNQFDQSQLVSMVRTLILSVTNPSEAAIGADKNLFTLYQR